VEGQGAEFTGIISKQTAGGPPQAGDRLLPEVRKKLRQQTTGLRPWASTDTQCCSIEEQTVNHHNTLTAAAG
jgi:hypothetical protein